MAKPSPFCAARAIKPPLDVPGARSIARAVFVEFDPNQFIARNVRAILYVYHFAKPGNPEHVYWTRDRIGIWLGPYSADSTELQEILRREEWLK